MLSQHRWTRCCIAAVLTACWASASAVTLGQAFEAAQGFDPQYKAARHELDSVRLGLPVVRAQMMPQLSLSGSTSSVTGERKFPNSAGQEVSTRLDYTAPQHSLQFRQPIVNMEVLARYRQAEAQIGAAEHTHQARGLELVDRLTTAYVQALLAKAALDVVRVEDRSVQAQLQRAQQRLLRGEGTRTEEAQARAALELTRFRLSDYQDQLNLAMLRLRRLTGIEIAELSDLAASFQPLPMEYGTVDEWLSAAMAQNPSLLARQQAIEVARRAVQRNQAGHLPRLDLVATYGRNRNDSVANLNQSNRLATVGVQLSVPLFSGGGVAASVNQAEAELARAQEDYRAERENLELELRRHVMAIASAAQKIEAQSNVVAANETALFGLERAQLNGLATVADVLDARTRLSTAQKELIQSRYEYLATRMRLQVVAGVPMQLIVDDLDRLLSQKLNLQSEIK